MNSAASHRSAKSNGSPSCGFRFSKSQLAPWHRLRKVARAQLAARASVLWTSRLS
jgi:hypothetical protein